MLIGVYGTLKKGQSNHRLLENHKFVGTTLLHGFDLYDLHAFPAVKEGTGYVFIEIYEVNDQQTLDRLDLLEGYPDLYTKDIYLSEFGKVLIYIYNPELYGAIQLETGYWSAYNKY